MDVKYLYPLMGRKVAGVRRAGINWQHQLAASTGEYQLPGVLASTGGHQLCIEACLVHFMLFY